MEYQYSYKDIIERQTQIAEAEGKGLMMLHDNFDNPDWKHGDPIIGTMTFTDVISPSPVIEPVRDLEAEIDELRAEIGKIKEVGG